MAIVALPFVADLPAANGAGKIFNITMLVWCGAFMAWFRAHPPMTAAVVVSNATGQAESPVDSDLRTIKVDGTTTRRGELDPVEQARLRFRVREEDASPAPAPAPAPTEQSRS